MTQTQRYIRYTDDDAEIASNVAGYEDVRDWAEDHEFARCETCRDWVNEWGFDDDGDPICDRCMTAELAIGVTP